MGQTWVPAPSFVLVASVWFLTGQLFHKCDLVLLSVSITNRPLALAEASNQNAAFYHWAPQIQACHLGKFI